ncbi:DUF397 domain-containing protein [Streptomyces sp. DG1A-41]|uniref:DUF397 domain-containing protein n=1 Tax=Streptomyces sp. DG1A-41 TaxID=3125779 RepID=UPI0030D02568
MPKGWSSSERPRLRDSKFPHGPALTIPPEAFAAFVDHVRWGVRFQGGPRTAAWPTGGGLPVSCPAAP